ncbi:acetyltransferase, partial [Vibrio cholerae]|nr:acetyltransferase [Vibrio cholerae]
LSIKNHQNLSSFALNMQLLAFKCHNLVFELCLMLIW